MNRLQTGLQCVCAKITGGVGAVIFLVLTAYSWRYTKNLSWGEVLADTRDNVWITFLCLAGLFVLLALIGKLAAGCGEKTALAVALALSAVMAVQAWRFVDAAHPYAVADQAMVQLGAEALANGDVSAVQGQSYYIAYSHQLYLISLFAGLLRLFGSCEPIVIYRVQSVLAGLGVLAVFGIARELFHSRKAELTALFGVMAFSPIWIYTAYYYGETLGVCASLYGVFFFLKANRTDSRHRWKRWLFAVLTGLSLLLSSMGREALLLVAAAMLIVQLLTFMRDRQWQPLAAFLLSLAVCMGIRGCLWGYLEERTRIHKEGSMPVILWIAMGFQEPENEGCAMGSYNGYNKRIFEETGGDVDEASRIAGQDLRERFLAWADHPGDLGVFLKDKILCQWNEPTYGCMVMTMYREDSEAWVEDLYSGGGVTRLINWLKQYQAVFYLGLLLGFLSLCREKEVTLSYLPGLIVIGGFLFSVIWEAKSRYIYPYIVLAIPFAAGSLVVWQEKVEQRIRKRYRQKRKSGGCDNGC